MPRSKNGQARRQHQIRQKSKRRIKAKKLAAKS